MHFCRKMSRVTVTRYYGPNRSGCLDWGVGQPNLGNSCILGKNGPETPPSQLFSDTVFSLYTIKINKDIRLPLI